MSTGRSLGLIALVLAVAGCAAQGPYRRERSTSKEPSRIAPRSSGPWPSSASARSRSTWSSSSTNVQLFKCALNNLQAIDDNAGKDVIGIYLGWRGQSWSLPLVK